MDLLLLEDLVGEGICGSCSMNIDGTNTLAALKSIEDIKGDVVFPLPHMSVVKDLVPDLTKAYAQLSSIEPWLKSDTPPTEGEEDNQKKKEPFSMEHGNVSYAFLLYILSILLVERGSLLGSSGSFASIQMDS